MRSRLLLLVALAALLALPPSVRPERALACSCGEIDPPSVALEEAAAVFSGKVLTAEGYGPVILTFQVYRVWKGSVTPTFVMMTRSLGAGDCGAPLYPGEEFLVYAYETDEHELLAAWFCTRTYPLEWAEEDLAFLGEGRLPGSPGPPETGAGAESAQSPADGRATSATPVLVIAGVMAAVALALAGSALVRARNRTRRS